MRFDAYTATILTEGSDDFLRRCQQDFGFLGASAMNPRQGYEEVYGAQWPEDITHQTHHLFIKRGGHDYPNLEMGGERTPEVVAAIRSWKFQQRVSRIDVCEDYSYPGSFDELVEIAIRIADRYNIDCRLLDRPREGESGRTLYLGKPPKKGGAKGTTLCRIYEKSYQLHSIGMISEADIDPDLTRIEFQVRPKTADKPKFANIAAEDVVGYSRWARELWLAISGLQVEPIPQERPHEMSEDAKLQWAATQIMGTLARTGQAQTWRDDRRLSGSHVDCLEKILPHFIQMLRVAAAQRDVHVQDGTARRLILNPGDFWEAEEAMQTREPGEDNRAADRLAAGLHILNQARQADTNMPNIDLDALVAGLAAE